MADAKFNDFENLVIKYVFNNTTSAVFPTTGTTVMSLQLHTANPGETGDTATSECAYTGYARVAVERSAVGWGISGNTATLLNIAAFPANAGVTTEAITHFSIGTSTVLGTTARSLYFGTVTPNITCSPGVTPRLTSATVVSEL
jgi:hypothetical protein